MTYDKARAKQKRILDDMEALIEDALAKVKELSDG